MEKNFYTDDFEQLLRERTENYKMYPSDAVWKNIHHRLHDNKKRRWAFLLLLITLSAGMGYLAGNMNASYQIAGSNSRITKIENIAQGQQTTSENTNQNHSAGKATIFSASAIIDPSAGYFNYYGNINDLSIYSKAGNNKWSARRSNNSISNDALLLAKEKDYINNSADNYTVVPVTSTSKVAEDAEQNNFFAEELGTKMTAAAIAHTSAKETKNSSTEKQSLNLTTNELAWQPIKLPGKRNRSHWGMNYYVTANSSYRKLLDESIKYSNSPSIQVPPGTSMDVNNIVSHKPSLGVEAGVGITYELSEGTWFKTGLQFNYNKYYINAFTYNLERAVIIDDPNNTVTSYSSYRSISGYHPATLENNNFQVSVPVGLDFRIAGNRSFQWYAGASLQPTYNLVFNTFLLSADKKNYVSANDFLRRWNFNAAFETGISFGFRNGMSLQLAPQFRYQLKPSYIDPYTIKEFLLEYGLKVAIKNPFRK